MALVNTDAIVLRTYNLAEADRIAVCLTRSAGLVRAVAKGARRMKSRFGAALEPFTLIRLAFYERENRDLVSISSAEILRSHFDLAAQPDASEVLAYMGELVSEFAPPHEANEKLFRMLSACVEALEIAPESSRLILRYFEVWLLRLAGLWPDLRSCSDCGAQLSESDTACLDVEVNPHCQRCSRGPATRLLPETQRLVVASQRLPPVEFASTFKTLSEQSEAQLAELTHRLIVRALERRPRTMLSSSR
ncbi:MAG: repair protein RecO [Blastocatellia bacterium]|jgi:DNA repair protein RecO (recombination protein O)|nr:repair protein RecO [Blastocatellia bacterium]